MWGLVGRRVVGAGEQRLHTTCLCLPPATCHLPVPAWVSPSLLTHPTPLHHGVFCAGHGAANRHHCQGRHPGLTQCALQVNGDGHQSPAHLHTQTPLTACYNCSAWLAGTVLASLPSLTHTTHTHTYKHSHLRDLLLLCPPLPHPCCSVLAAANPLYGTYDRSSSITMNVALPDSLLSRFDMLFVVLDNTNTSMDKEVRALGWVGLLLVCAVTEHYMMLATTVLYVMLSSVTTLCCPALLPRPPLLTITMACAALLCTPLLPPPPRDVPRWQSMYCAGTCTGSLERRQRLHPQVIMVHPSFETHT